MSGLLFYWTSWMFWIILTFLTKISKERTIYALLILIMIIASNIHITIDQISISLGVVILTITMFYMNARSRQPFMHLFISLTIAILYLANLVWEKITPVWIFLPKVILIPVICSLIISFLTKSFKSRIITSVLGLCVGEIIYGKLLNHYHLQENLGSFMLLDITFMTVLFITIIEAIRVVQIKLYEAIYTYKKDYWLQSEKP